ncbi:MAG: adenosylmethionine--8-amino-7-oxononanoate transaminase, partial [Chitinophagia bacterium]|nr:adenosylmethionine--8-amino-7-oxononanoate transaminase [Chitinophagia bacterium]
HPFTPLLYAPNNIVIERGEGASFIASDGTRYLDGIASWWVNLHGHCQPQIVEAVANQAARLEHAIFAGFTHQPGIALAEGLLRHLPGFSKVFFSDNGSTAVEVALKMAVQYWWNKGEPRRKIIAFREAYHGDTFGGMSVAARNAFNRPFEGLLFDVVHLELPTADNIEDVAKELEIHLQTGDACCFIFEPLVLGAGGMLMYEAAHLSRLINLCRLHGCLTIADEVMTGFGRTGTFFAIDQLSSQPDIICLSKGLTGGFFPLGATVCTEAIYNAYLVNDKTKTFFHGHSYTGNPITCAAALASLQLMEQESTWQHINRIHQAHIGCAAALQSAPGVEQVRVTGTILAMNVKTSEATGYLNSKADDLAAFFIQRNIILRPLGNVLYVLPPYCISQEELQAIYNAITELLLP